MKIAARYIVILLFFVAPAAFAENDKDEEPPYTQQELDRMLAPIALYPDSLLSHILMAATYPLEVIEAARWSRDNPDLKGQDAVRAVEDRDWDPSVKSLVAFPRILEQMDAKLRWTEDLGNAFLAQEAQVMDTVQQLRKRAYDAGHLRSHEHIRVVRSDGLIVIESVYPEVVYIPYYSPLVVYGPWWHPGYPPVYWGPWPHYRAHYHYPAFHWSVGIFVGPHFFFAVSNWHHRHLVVAHHRPFYYHRPHFVPVHHHHVHKWHHDPYHRHGVAYKHHHTKQYVRVDGPHHARSEVRVDRRGWSPAHRSVVHGDHDGRRHSDRDWHARRDFNKHRGEGSERKREHERPHWRTPSSPHMSAGSTIVQPARPSLNERRESRRHEVNRLPTPSRTPSIDGAGQMRSRAPSLQHVPPATPSPFIRQSHPRFSQGADAGRHQGHSSARSHSRGPDVRHSAPTMSGRSHSFGHSGGGRGLAGHSGGSRGFEARPR